MNINSEQLACPSSKTTISTPNASNENAQESTFIDSVHPSPLSAPKNTDFHADYLALKDVFINEICVVRNEVISNKQYVDQVLVDANINSQTSKLITNIEVLEKENMVLRRIVINKEIIIQKPSSVKNITKEISKNDNTDCPINKGEEYSFCEIVTECQSPTKENSHQKKDFGQIDKYVNNINK